MTIQHEKIHPRSPAGSFIGQSQPAKYQDQDQDDCGGLDLGIKALLTKQRSHIPNPQLVSVAGWVGCFLRLFALVQDITRCKAARGGEIITGESRQCPT